MERLKELYGYKARYENELLFAQAKIAVVDEMIADEKAKCCVQTEEATEENNETIASI